MSKNPVCFTEYDFCETSDRKECEFVKECKRIFMDRIKMIKASKKNLCMRR